MATDVLPRLPSPLVGDAAVRNLRSGESSFALKLERLHPDRSLGRDGIDSDAVAVVMALDGHHDARFVLQMVAHPDAKRTGVGELDVHLITTVTGEFGDAPKADRVEEICDDLLDILSAPPVRWSFVPVSSDDELAIVLDPLYPAHMAEVARREEPCGPLRVTTHPGFLAQGPSTIERDLWSMWTLGPAAGEMKRLASVLLAQEAPVAIRVLVHPTSLTEDEREQAERVVMEANSSTPDLGLLRASLATLEALLYLRPVFETRCLVASAEPLSRSMLSALGHAMSEPNKHGRTQAGQLEGGFAVIRGGLEVDDSILREAFGSMTLGEPIPSLAPPGLERLRRLLGPWEASNLFRFPFTRDDFPGMSSISTPELEPPLGDLPAAGQRIGRLITHGQRRVLLDPEERFRHLYVSGQTGTGKSTLLLNLILQDVAAGAGVAVLDPHGDLVEAVLRNVPDQRRDDVVLVDPADPVAVVGVNLLEAETPVQQGYIIAELCNMFYELFDPNRQGFVGARFETMLRQAALLLLAHPEEPSSLLDITTLFIDGAVRKHLVQGLTDPVLTEFWLGEMQMDRAREWQEVVSWFRSKFEIFRTSKLVRSVIGQAESTISFSDILSERRILLVNLSKGMLGEYNSSLIGHIIFTRLWSAALERATVDASQRPDFFVYVDEFQNMTSDSLPDVLSEARKFRLGITLANQFFSQIPERTRDAIMGNVGNRITFRVGPKDATLFSMWMGRGVHEDDLSTLPNHVAIASLSDAGVPLDPIVLRTDAPADSGDAARAGVVRDASRARWARPVEQVERAFFDRWRHVEGSMSARLARPLAPQRAPGSFLDEWLARHQAAMRVTMTLEGSVSPQGSVIQAIKVIKDASGLGLAQVHDLVKGQSSGDRRFQVDRESVSSVIADLASHGLVACVLEEDADGDHDRP